MTSLTLEEKIELAEEAKRMLSPRSLLNLIISRLTAECMDIFIQEPIGSLTAQGAHAKLRALNEIKQNLKMLVDDATIAKRNASRGAQQ